MGWLTQDEWDVEDIQSDLGAFTARLLHLFCNVSLIPAFGDCSGRDDTSTVFERPPSLIKGSDRYSELVGLEFVRVWWGLWPLLALARSSRRWRVSSDKDAK